MKTPTVAQRVRIPAGVWMLGFVSLLMDVSFEMIHSPLPLFMVGVLGASALKDRNFKRCYSGLWPGCVGHLGLAGQRSE